MVGRDNPLLITLVPYSSQFLETLSGLATIRAFGWQSELITLNNERLDNSQKPIYLLYSVQRWLNLVLDLIASGLAIVLITVAVELNGTISAGFAGLALYNVMTLSEALKATVSIWTVLETSIGAVARVKLFVEETPSENLSGETSAPPDDWPAGGAIEFNNISASYRSVITSGCPKQADVSLYPGRIPRC